MFFKVISVQLSVFSIQCSVFSVQYSVFSIQWFKYRAKLQFALKEPVLSDGGTNCEAQSVIFQPGR